MNVQHNAQQFFSQWSGKTKKKPEKIINLQQDLDKFHHIMLYAVQVITDCIGMCKSVYKTITHMFKAPLNFFYKIDHTIYI